MADSEVCKQAVSWKEEDEYFTKDLPYWLWPTFNGHNTVVFNNYDDDDDKNERA